MRIVWREWFSEEDVAELTSRGTLPRNETILDYAPVHGADAASMVAEHETACGSEMFRKDTQITITEPPEFAGSYSVSVEYNPTFYASKLKS
jgi:hypothetical protein